jgi:hypothetical protein
MTKVSASHETAIQRRYHTIARIVRVAMEENRCDDLCADPQACACRKIGVRMATTFKFEKREAGRPSVKWYQRTTEKMLMLRAAGKPIDAIATEIGKTRSQIYHKLRKLDRLRQGESDANLGN